MRNRRAGVPLELRASRTDTTTRAIHLDKLGVEGEGVRGEGPKRKHAAVLNPEIIYD